MKKNPLAQMKEKFGSKDKLVDQILELVKRPADTTRDQLKKKLLSQSNRKLMTLLDRELKVKDRFGGREKLIESLLGSAKSRKTEDKETRKELNGLSTGELLVLARSRLPKKAPDR